MRHILMKYMLVQDSVETGLTVVAYIHASTEQGSTCDEVSRVRGAHARLCIAGSENLAIGNL